MSKPELKENHPRRRFYRCVQDLIITGND